MGAMGMLCKQISLLKSFCLQSLFCNGGKGEKKQAISVGDLSFARSFFIKSNENVPAALDWDQYSLKSLLLQSPCSVRGWENKGFLKAISPLTNTFLLPACFHCFQCAEEQTAWSHKFPP